MNELTISVNVRVTLSEETMNFLGSLLNGNTTKQVAAKQEAKQQPNQDVKDTDKQPVSKEPESKKTESPATTEKPKANAQPKVTIEEIRSVLGTKVEAHRSAIKAKLNEFGAKNATVLDVKYYDDFYEFLNSL